MSDTTCPSCGEANAADSKFCNECGTRLGEAPCGSCGETLEAGSKFCRHCGAKTGSAKPAAAAPPAAAAEPAPVPVASDPAPRAARPAPPPPKESKAAVWVGVGVAVLGFAWLAINKQAGPPPPVAGAAADPHTGHEHPPGGAPPAGAAAVTAPYAGGGGAAAAGPVISGTITVADNLKDQVPVGGHFFIIARMAGSKMPMPVAVSKIPAAAGAVPYTIGPENVMGGGGFTGPFDLTVRWDQDGSVGKQPGDLSGVCSKNPVNPGDTGADIVLTERL